MQQTEIGYMIDKAKENAGFESDIDLAKHLRISRSAISRWRHDEGAPEPMLAVRLAELGETDPFRAMVAAEAARTDDQTKKAFWEKMLSEWDIWRKW